MALTPLQQIGQDAHAFLSGILLDVITSGSTIVSTALTNIKSNPSISNAAAQIAAITITAPLALPNLESEAIQQGATVGLQILQIAQAAATQAAQGQTGSGTTSSGSAASPTA